MTRVPWPREVRREAVDFYGGFDVDPLCVITQERHADLHHLDGDHGNSVFVNATPLSPSLNAAIERTPGSPLQGHSPESLFQLAGRCFTEGQYARAHGICRLMAFLPFSHYVSGHEVCRFAGRALEACRVLGRPDLGVDTIDRNICTMLNHPRLLASTPTYSLGVLCRTLGSWFCCLEDYFAGSAWYRRALRLLHHAKRIAPHAEEEYLHTCRKLLHAWQMATGQDAPRLRESVEREYRDLNPLDQLDSKAGDLVITARAILRHSKTADIEPMRHKLHALAAGQFGQPFDPNWLVYPERRPDDLNPWNWTGVVDVEAEFQLVYDKDTDGALGRIQKLFQLHHDRGGRVFRGNCGKAWRTLAYENADVTKLIVSPREQARAWRASTLLLTSFERAIELRCVEP